MRGEQKLRCGAPGGGNLIERRAKLVGLSLDEERVIIERPQLVDFRRGRSRFPPRLVDVFEILTASRVRAEHRRHETECPLYSPRLHFAQRVGEERMPVAVAPVNRKTRSFLFEKVL